MRTGFEIKDDGSVPIVFVNGRRLHLVSIAYKWITASDVSAGSNVCVAEGYFEGEADLKRFMFDIPKQKIEKGKMQ